VVCLSSSEQPIPEFENEEQAYQWLDDRYDGCEACMAEWLVIPTDKIDGCETLGDLFVAAGMIRVCPATNEEYGAINER